MNSRLSLLIKIKQSIRIFNLLNGYCSIQGNNRNLLVKDMTERSYELSESIVFIYLWQSNFYQKLPEDYQELFSIF